MGKASEKSKCWLAFGTWVKWRDSHPSGVARCISCDRELPFPNSDGMAHAGHYYPRSTVFAKLYFAPENCHTQCMPCNTHLFGNVAEYRKGLIKRYGEEYVNELEDLKRMNEMIKLYDHDYKEMAKEYRKKVREMKKERGL